MNRLQELENLIKKHNDLYYNSESEISDDAYDALKDELESIDPENQLLTQIDAPIKTSRQWNKGKHSIFMGSLNKVSNIEEFEEWWNKIDNLELIWELKYDGLSVSLDYDDNGNLIQATTRGEGGIEGEVITRNVLKMKNVYEKLPFNNNKKCSFRAEIMLSKENFKKINEIKLSKDEKLFANPRNGAFGIARNFDGTFCEYLELKYYDMTGDFFCEKIKAELLNSNFNLDYYSIRDMKTIKNVYSHFITEKRERLPFEIDGFVLKIDDIKKQKQLGIISNRPKGQMALKFPPIRVKTTIKNLIHATKRTGHISVKAEVEPVNLQGAIIKFATLHNYDYIQNTLGGLNIGDEVTIERKGDIVPKVMEVINRKSKTAEPPKNCPTCGESTRIDWPFVICDNQFCDAKIIDRIIWYCKKLDLEDIGGKFIESLYNNNLIKNTPDIYKLEVNQIASLNGMGEKSAQHFVDELKNKSTCSVSIFLQSLSIDGLGEYNSDKLISHFGEDNIMDVICSLDKLKEVFSEETANKIFKQEEVMKETIEKLKENVTFKKVNVENSNVTGLRFCITGALSMKRDDYVKILKENGGIYKSSVTGDLDYLVNNDLDSTSGKNKKAHELDKKIINEDEFRNMLGI